MHFIRTFSIVALIIASSACNDTTAPKLAPNIDGLPLAEQQLAVGVSARRLGVLGFNLGAPLLDVPATVQAGQAFNINTTVFGGGCVESDTTVVVAHAQSVDVFPYQSVFTPPANGACTGELRYDKRTVSVTFAKAGVGLVRILGRAHSGDSLVIVTRAVMVQ